MSTRRVARPALESPSERPPIAPSRRPVPPAKVIDMLEWLRKKVQRKARAGAA
jgi:hypothetical protein